MSYCEVLAADLDAVVPVQLPVERGVGYLAVLRVQLQPGVAQAAVGEGLREAVRVRPERDLRLRAR